MACQPSATATLFGTITSTSVSTSFSGSVSNLPSTVTTRQSESCVATSTLTDNSTTCISTTTINDVSTIAGGQTTIQVPFVVTVTDVKSAATQTLFASCTSSDNKPDTTSTPVSSSTPSPRTTATPTTPKTTSVLSTSTPPPSTVTAQSSTTLANGSVAVTTVVVVTSGTPSAVYVPTTVPDQHVQNGSDGHSNAKMGAIIGGSIGGALVLFGLAGIIWFFIRKRKTWDDIFDNDHGEIDFRPSRLVRDNGSGRMDMDMDMGSESEPKPYTYGLVGQSSIPPFSSPPGSPSMQSSIPDTGYYPDHRQSPSGQSYQYNMPDFTPDYGRHMQQYAPDHIETQHNRRPSGTSLLFTPLVLPASRVTPEPSIAPSAPSVYSNHSANARPGYSRDPSTASSQAPLTGNSRPSTGSSGSRPHTGNTTYQNVMPAQMQQAQRGQQRNASAERLPAEYRRPSSRTEQQGRPPSNTELPYGRPPSANDQVGAAHASSGRTSSSVGRPVSPRTLMLANWNPSTDAISIDSTPGPSARPSFEQQRRANNASAPASTSAVNRAGMSSGPSRIAAPSSQAPPQAGPSSSSQDIIRHTDGGRVANESSSPPTGDVKEVPAFAPPAYSE